MNERTRIKICGIREPDHARIAAEAGADAIGLVFYGDSPRHVDAVRAARISKSLPPYIAAVGLFVNAGADEIRLILEEVPLDLLQFQGDEPPEFCNQFGRPLRARGAHGEGDRFGRIFISLLGCEGASSRCARARRAGRNGAGLRLERHPARAPGAAHTFRRAHGAERGPRDSRSAAVGRGCV
jgi:hypothetical protein